MGNGGIYAKRKKQERPKSPRQRYEYETRSQSSGSTDTTRSDYEVDRYIRKGSNQKGIDSALNTVGRKKYEHKRGRKRKRGE